MNDGGELGLEDGRDDKVGVASRYSTRLAVTVVPTDNLDSFPHTTYHLKSAFLFW